ncbi:MAG: protein-tyrosine-phosphatase [Cytophagaceae bacterium]|jgi:protein-tyrosine phosphatase/arsenate reductase|nr:protein-tyrosine-phosphatase [Cytophagaceae bacterium]
MYTTLKNYLESLTHEFHLIDSNRKEQLSLLKDHIAQYVAAQDPLHLLYVCTHNSRRSHMGQVWSAIAASYYGVKGISTHSAGTEVTAFNPNAIKALRDAGCMIQSDGATHNPKYSVYFSDSEPPLICFSKTYEHESIPKEHLCAVMTCTEADGNCPMIPGTTLRVSTPYRDPKEFDGTPQQEASYAGRCRQIALECMFVFSSILPQS